MKKLIALLLTAAMLLGLSACGGAAEPAETAPAATEPVDQVTEAPTEAIVEAPTEDPNAYTVYELRENESYMDAVWAHGFWEVDMDVCVADAAEYGAKGAQATPLSLELNRNGFRMEVDYTGFDYFTNKVVPYGTVEIIGTKADGPANISDINPEDYQHTGSSTYTDQNGVSSDIGSFANGYLLEDIYWFYNVDDAGKVCGLVYVKACYYVSTHNLYNIIYRVPAEFDDRSEPSLLVRVNSMDPYSPFRPVVQTLTYGDFTFEMSQFAIQCGEERYVYNYRPGMSLSDWACSELNTDGWIPWYGDEVLSPDRAYSCNTGYLDIADYHNLLTAEEYDGKTNYINNDGVLVENSGLDLGGMDFSDGGSVVIMSGDEMEAYMAQHGLDSMADLQDYLTQNGIGDMPAGEISPSGTSGEVSLDDIVNAGATEEREITERGNISVPVAHMVNAKTPLFTPGFRIIGKEAGLAAYHSVEMGDNLYLLDDILDIYMNGVADELIPHIKLYAFPESEAFMASLEGHTILNVHPTPLEQGNEMLTIPENAMCLTFQRVPDGQEAPNSPNPRKPGHENLNKDAVYTRYVTKEDPNFGEGVNLVFAITFDDELVYWIHMGANFHETVDVEWLVNAMPY